MNGKKRTMPYSIEGDKSTAIVQYPAAADAYNIANIRLLLLIVMSSHFRIAT